jgi:D-alanyl-D-alanine carboxypeptidase/D-alanyl-D-alanine-endopeptidase (penicillin-binding protein 4)
MTALNDSRHFRTFGSSTFVLSCFAAVFLLSFPAAAQKPLEKHTTGVTTPHTPAHQKVRPDAARFHARVDAALADAHAQKASWGVLVADRDTGETLYELNADRFFTPASNAKLFTSALALATLGSVYQFRTTLESRGTLGTDGRLSGDLILVGRGDPDLSNRKFPYQGKVEREGPAEKALVELADAAAAKGLKEIDGDVVADDTYFPYDPYPAGWSVGDLFFSFGAPVSAIAFNDNTISIEVQPGVRPGDPASVSVEPWAARENLTDAISTSPADEKPALAVVRQPGPDFILLRGSIPLGHVPIKLDLAMTEPAESAARALKQLLEARGVRITGGISVRHAPPPESMEAVDPPPGPVAPQPPVDSNSIVLAEHMSPPLLEIVRVTNKVSHNLHAELLLRTVARERAGTGSTEAGINVEQDFLKTAGIADGDVVFSDGSGLSRDNLVTPRAVVALLRYAATQMWGADYVSTLGIAGVDGTLETRMTGTAAAGLIQAKTGAIEHVRSMSGYATTLRGEHIVFAIFGNNNPQHGRDATEAIDAIGVAMVETLGLPRAPKKKE